jgi:hypothetical protein
MESRFNLYDLFAIFVPGAVLCTGLGVFLMGFGWLDLKDIDWSATLFLLPIAYVVGMVVHQHTRQRIRVTRHSAALLSDGDSTFTEGFKDALWAKIRTTFAVADFEDRRSGNAQRQMAFDLCYDYVLQHGKGVYTENFNAQYGMCRNMLSVILWLAILATLYTVFEAFLELKEMRIP